MPEVSEQKEAQRPMVSLFGLWFLWA